MPDLSATRPADAAPVATAWGQQVHDMLEGIQAGKGTLVYPGGTPDSTTLTVVFPRAYAVAPIVVVSVETGITRAIAAKLIAGTVTTTQFQVQAQHVAGTNVASSNLPFDWIAIGTPA